ncbi:MAG TPA: lysylphosphatidylglycerol synthase transmembrane domain-containing protein [Mycobacteriales bacterium]|jgi:uncharacterized protein (TIRG00374 family)|nr:lysylphosphatidylglycerol synthase transmembrane domain-containing protein [Mycobacteriales bacterium]
MNLRRVRIAAQLLALGLVVWWFVVPQLRGTSSSLHQLFDVDSSWLPVALAAELGSLAAYTFCTRAVLGHHARPSYPQIACIDLSSIGLGHCLPDGGAAGTALSWRLLVGVGVPSGDAVFAKVSQGISSAVALHALLFSALLLGGLTGGFTTWSAAPIALASATLLVITALIAALRRPGFRAGAERCLRLLPRVGPKLADRTTSLYDCHLDERVKAATRDRQQLLEVLGWSATNWTLDAAALWASLNACGAHPGLEAIAVAFAIASYGTWLPITPSGLGVSESLMIPSLIAFGAPHAAAALGVLTWRAIAYWLPIPMGATAYGALHLGRLRAVRALPAATADSMG